MDAKKKKLLVIGGVIAAITIVGIIIAVNRKKRKNALGKQIEEQTGDSSSTISTQPDTHTGSESGTVTTNISSGLPNRGLNCGAVHTDYDGDFDYVKCGGIWHTRSKANPKTASTRGLYPDWVTLEFNVIATGRLNSRYPNG